jgi:hypothetical protein
VRAIREFRSRELTTRDSWMNKIPKQIFDLTNSLVRIEVPQAGKSYGDTALRLNSEDQLTARGVRQGCDVAQKLPFLVVRDELQILFELQGLRFTGGRSNQLLEIRLSDLPKD